MAKTSQLKEGNSHSDSWGSFLDWVPKWLYCDTLKSYIKDKEKIPKEARENNSYTKEFPID